ncbi:hypothetical protein HOLleu_26649 [Holothuria leucospilota]|uniref:Uncharacterized protein n=1 Tax=Holothuria leucospilota TaxID=206669 RepID=A0A9Q1H1R0_HOLLE|nr:hypothetical protein HOLleu_26649 [Holothuria leucospilota]
MDIRRFVKHKSSGGGASTSRGKDESVEPSKKRQRVDSVEMSVEPEPQSHPGAGSTHQSDQRLSSSTDHFADVANYAADGDDDSDLHSSPRHSRSAGFRTFDTWEFQSVYWLLSMLPRSGSSVPHLPWIVFPGVDIAETRIR